MKKFLTLIVIIVAVQLAAQTSMPSFWHTNEEIGQELQAWADTYPDIAHFEIIGYSTEAPYQEPMPIYALKISDNADIDEDEPAVFFVGQCHAEEVTGVETVLFYAQRLLQGQSQYPYNLFIEELETWFIPTINPAGLNVVMNMNDVSYRKTVRDNNGNGIFDYIDMPGFDLDGVDLNRNYDFCWIHGKTLAAIDDTERYDYYRGPAPFSESETQAIRSLADQQHFIYGINFHDSRTGNFSQKVFYPWEFKGQASRRNPDYLICKQIGDNVAGEIVTETGSGTYEPSASQGRIGKSTQWFYAEYGTIQLTIEVAGNQPDSTHMIDTVGKNHEGIKWMLMRTLNGHADISSMLTGHVYDAVTNEPLVAEIVVEERQSGYFTPRKSDELYGRFWRPLVQGTYTLTVKKNGYETSTQSVVVNPTSWTTRNVYLQPLAPSVYNGTMVSGSEPVDGLVIVYDTQNDTIDVVDGNFTINSWTGTRKVIFRADGYATCVDDAFEFEAGTHGLNIELSPADVLYQEDFEDAENLSLDLEGPWQVIDDIAWIGNALTDSWNTETDQDSYYAPNCDVYVTTQNAISLSGHDHYNLEFMQYLYTETDWDFVHVEVSTDGEEWTELWNDNGKRNWWNRVIIPLDEYAGESVYLRFHLTADSPDADLVDPGWTIDNIVVHGGDYNVVGVTGEDIPEVVRMQLNPNYPNPFNPQTVFSYTIPSSAKTAEINVFNIRGQRVEKLVLDKEEMSRGTVTWDASSQSSGIYFYRLSVDGKTTMTRKACLIK